MFIGVGFDDWSDLGFVLVQIVECVEVVLKVTFVYFNLCVLCCH